MRVFVAAAALVLSFASALAYSANVEGWEIRYFPETAPTGCIMGGTFQDGTRFSIIVSKKYDWALGLSNANWNLRKDATTDVAAYVDRQFIASGKAEHVTATTAVLPLTGVEPFRALQKGQRLDLQTPAGNLNFLLKGSGKAMYAVLDCVRTLAPNQPAPPSAQAPPKDFKMLSYEESSAMTADILTAAGVSSYRFDPPKQDSNITYFRLADGTRGMFLAARGAGTKNADDYASFVVGKWAETCKGEFISGKQPVPSVDGSVVRKVVTTCRLNNNEAVVTETTVVRRPDGFLMELSMLTPVAAGADTASDAGKGDRAAVVGATMRTQDRR